MSSFYSRFLEECTKNKVAPSAAAEKAGFSRAASTGWKKGALPSDVNLQALADYFGISVSEFRKCEDIRKRDIQLGISRMHEELLNLEEIDLKQKQKKTATSGDGREMTVNDDINSFANSLFIRLPIEKKIFLINQMQAELQTQEAQDVQ